MPPKFPKKAPGPDELVRQEAGSYLSKDERFEVRQSDTAWYLVDRKQTNEFGQELMHGPFPSMKAAKAAMSAARDIKPLLRSVKRPTRSAQKKEPPKPPPSWIDKLPGAEAAAVRRTIRVLEREGVANAEAVVRKDRESGSPAVATLLIQRELANAIDELPEKERKGARTLLSRIGRVLAEGERNREPLPGWRVVEIGPDHEPTGRPLRIGD